MCSLMEKMCHFSYNRLQLESDTEKHWADQGCLARSLFHHPLTRARLTRQLCGLENSRNSVWFLIQQDKTTVWQS